ncbi:gaba permease [Stemphylium lycopersici]|uniref:Gaba permease n=1 Tax=Stemphylium lycopersici TaxID=183478 RepID=A0A364ND15_STELY|nr:gaba permease [Stemphylium lycopersici]
MILLIVSLGFSKLAIIAFVHHLTPSSIWWTVVSVSNIITEVAIVTLELGITAQLQVRRQRKAVVMSLFAFRLLVLVAAATQLYFFHRESKDQNHKVDLTLGYWRSSICSQALQCLAIVTTCLPYTKLFMEGFESGLMRLDDLRRRGEHTSKDDSKGYQLMDISRSGQPGPLRRSDNEPETSIQVSRSWDVQVDTAGRK